MNIQEDPFLTHRREAVAGHRLLRTFDISDKACEIPVLKGLDNPISHGHFDDFAWSEVAVNNIIEATRKGWIRLKEMPDDELEIEFLPLDPSQFSLGHITELDVFAKNLKRTDGLYGDPDPRKLSYLQTTDFLVEGYIDDESDGQQYVRLYVNSSKLGQYRDVYLDPESIHITDYEFGRAFAVYGGVPFLAIQKAEVMCARRVQQSSVDYNDSIEDLDEYSRRQAERLRTFIADLRNKS